MDAVTARRYLEAYTQWDTGKGTLTSAEVDDLLELAKVTDEYGLLPTDDGWTETYDVRGAAAVGWEWRAAKLTDQFKVAVGAGRVFDRQWTPEFCLRMAATMRGADGGGGLVSVSVRSGFYAGL